MNTRQSKSFSVSIVIPNWNGAKLLMKNLPAVIASSPGCEIIVVDDASTDDSVDLLKTRFPHVKTIMKIKNSGFAQTVNVGVQDATRDIVVLLNTDVVPEKGYLDALAVHFSDPLVFGVGCLEKNPERGEVVFRGRSVACWQKGFYIHNRGEVDKRDTAWVAGGSSAFRRSTWKQLGGLDILYNPFYWEDIDLSYRARKAGFKVVFEPKSAVWHYHQQGAIKTRFQVERVNRIVFRNQFIFMWKNLTDGSLWMEHILWLPIRILQELLRGRTTMLVGFLWAIGKIPTIIARRREYAGLWKMRDREIATY